MSDRKKVIEAARRQTSLKPLPPFAHLQTVSLDRPLTIVGSGRCAHLRVRSKSISRVHAVCVNLAGRVYLKDLASRGGVFVNDRPVGQASLKDGDRVRLGTATFQFIDHDSMPAEGAAPLSAHFCTNGGRSTHLVEQPLILVGHRSTADFVVPGDEVSSAHTIIFAILGRWMLRDLDSRTGTFVNGHRVRQAVLKAGDVIGVGRARITFEPGAEAEAEAADESLQECEANAISPAELEERPTLLAEPIAPSLPEPSDVFEEALHVGPQLLPLPQSQGAPPFEVAIDSCVDLTKDSISSSSDSYNQVQASMAPTGDQLSPAPESSEEAISELNPPRQERNVVAVLLASIDASGQRSNAIQGGAEPMDRSPSLGAELHFHRPQPAAPKEDQAPQSSGPATAAKPVLIPSVPVQDESIIATGHSTKSQAITLADGLSAVLAIGKVPAPPKLDLVEGPLLPAIEDVAVAGLGAAEVPVAKSHVEIPQVHSHKEKSNWEVVRSDVNDFGFGASETRANILAIPQIQADGSVAPDMPRFGGDNAELVLDVELTSQIHEWGPLAMAVLGDMHPPAMIDLPTEEDVPPVTKRRTVPRIVLTMGLTAIIILASLLYYGAHNGML